jgi:hypothetical protein
MGLKDVLAKMKLVEADEPRSSAAAASPPRADLDELLGSVPPPRPVPADAAATADGQIPDFAEIYRAAGLVDPPHGFTAFKVLEILSAPEFASLQPKAKAAALAAFLKMSPAGPVPIADVIQDAVRRDQALDQFESCLRSRLAESADRLEAETAELQARIDQNRAALDAERRRLDDWLAGKRAEERRLAEAVAPFVEKPPISVS